MIRARTDGWARRGIQRRLITWLIGPLLLVLLVSLSSDYQIAHSRADEAFDLALADAAQDIASHLSREGRSLRLDLSEVRSISPTRTRLWPGGLASG